MTRDELEFRISEYLDGTLSSAETAVLERRLETDAEAARILAEYRQVEGLVKSAALPMPAVDFDVLSARISDAVAADDASRRSGVLYSFRWVRRVAGVAVAASVMLGIGLWAHHAKTNGRVAVVEVVGPDVATAQAVEEIDIGPAPSIAEQAPLAVHEAVVTRPQRLVIASAAGNGNGTRPRLDSLPY